MKSNGHVRGIGLAIFALGIIIARAEAQQIRGSAFAAPKHSWSVGIFNPLAYQFATDWGIGDTSARRLEHCPSLHHHPRFSQQRRLGTARPLRHESANLES